MTKKLLGLGVTALFCVGMASAATFSESCPPGATVTGPGTPAINGNEVCAPFTVPTGYTLTAIDLFESGDFSLGNSGGNTLNYALTFTGGGVSLATGSSTEAVEGSTFASTFAFTGTGCAEVGGSDTEDCTSAVSVGQGTTVTSIVTTWSGSWGGASTGLTNTGDEDFGSTIQFTYTANAQTPEPASLLMMGGGLIVGAVVLRRKRRA